MIEVHKKKKFRKKWDRLSATGKLCLYDAYLTVLIAMVKFVYYIYIRYLHSCGTVVYFTAKLLS